jgi:hypothetical protein
MENNPLRHENGELVFRPGGHGALLENLNDIEQEYIFVKNVDNVVPDRLKETTFKYKKLLGGYLIKLQNQIFDYLNKIDNGNLSGEEIEEIKNFAENYLWITFPDNFNKISHSGKNAILKNKLNRPLRVCGVVENQNEPGGGPFMCINSRGEVSPQIIEKNQIDLDDPAQKKIMESATHFNPVDLVCGIYNYKGEKFNLMEYRDPETALISTKFKDGEKLKALELPGLWNGSMADWITVFVDVPLVTFNPVKEVNDLLRKNHLP